MSSLTFDPAIIENPRSRRVRLKVLDSGRVELVIPPGYPRDQALAFAASKADWVQRCLEKTRDSRRGRDPAIDGPFPETIRLAAAGETWTVEYAGQTSGTASTPARVSLRKEGNRQLLVTTGTDPAPAHGMLRRWLHGRARGLLEPWTRELAREHGFQVGRITFRNQKSRWGSCSSKGNVSLNIRLMLVAPELAAYVIAHELTHLDHPDHSARFWKALATIESDYRARERALRSAGHSLPAWVTESTRIR